MNHEREKSTNIIDDKKNKNKKKNLKNSLCISFNLTPLDTFLYTCI